VFASHCCGSLAKKTIRVSRAMDVPLAVLFGGEIRPLPAYDSFGMLDHRTDLA
jgi:hypothetical protein